MPANLETNLKGKKVTKRRYSGVTSEPWSNVKINHWDANRVYWIPRDALDLFLVCEISFEHIFQPFGRLLPRRVPTHVTHIDRERLCFQFLGTQWVQQGSSWALLTHRLMLSLCTYSFVHTEKESNPPIAVSNWFLKGKQQCYIVRFQFQCTDKFHKEVSSVSIIIPYTVISLSWHLLQNMSIHTCYTKYN